MEQPAEDRCELEPEGFRQLFVVLVILGDELVADGEAGGVGVAVGHDFGNGEGANGHDEGLATYSYGGEVGADGLCAF